MTENQPRNRSTWILAVAALGYVVLTSVLTHMPLSREVQRAADKFDKLAHFGLYFVMACLITLALRPRRGAADWSLLLTIGILSMDEAWQAVVPSRHVDPWDWLAGVMGACCGWGLMKLSVRRSLTPRSQNS